MCTLLYVEGLAATRPFAITGVAAHSRIPLLQSDFSLFICTKPTRFSLLPTNSNTYLLSSRPWERGHGPNDEQKPLCSRRMRISTATPVNAKGLLPWDKKVGLRRPQKPNPAGFPRSARDRKWFLRQTLWQKVGDDSNSLENNKHSDSTSVFNHFHFIFAPK